MFTNREFVVPQHVIDVLPVNFPETPEQVIALLTKNLMAQESSLSFVAEKIRESQLYQDLKSTLENHPAQMTTSELICYAVGTANNAKDMEHVLKQLATQQDVASTLTDPINYMQWFECMPRLYRHALFLFYWETDRYRSIREKSSKGCMQLTPHEFFFVLFEVHYHVTKLRRQDSDIEKYLGFINQYFGHADKAFELACHIPKYYLLRLVCDLHINGSKLSNMATDWMLTPKTETEIALHAMFTGNVKKLDAEQLRAAILVLRNQYTGVDPVIHCLQGLEVTAAFADETLPPVEQAKALRLGAKDSIYINLASADFAGLDLSRANLEYVFVLPPKLSLQAKWRELDRDKLIAGSGKYYWKDIDASHVVNFDGAILQGTRLPYCLGLTQVSLLDAQLTDSTIFEFPLLCPRFRLNQSLFTCDDADQRIAFLSAQITKVQQNIELMLKLPLQVPFMYVAKVDKEDPLHHKNLKSKHVAAQLVAQYISAVADEEVANAIYDAAFSHPLFMHERKLSAMANKALLFALPRKLDFLNLVHFSDSQNYFLAAKEKREYLLSEQGDGHEMLGLN